MTFKTGPLKEGERRKGGVNHPSNNTTRPPRPGGSQPPSQRPRYRLIQDDAGHWYVIRKDQEREFAAWLEWESDDDDELTAHFDQCRVDGPHSVTFGEWEQM